MRFISAVDFAGQTAWDALDIAAIDDATVRLHWADAPYIWHVNDGEEVFAVENVRKCFVCNNFLAESLVHENNGFPMCGVCRSNMIGNNSDIVYH